MGRTANQRRARCPAHATEDLRRIWSRLSVIQTKVAAAVCRHRDFIWVTGSWRYTPDFAEDTSACLDLMYIETSRLNPKLRYDKFLFEECGQCWAGSGHLAMMGYKLTCCPQVKLISVMQRSAKAVMAAHAHMAREFEKGGFAHRRNRLSLINAMIGR